MEQSLFKTTIERTWKGSVYPTGTLVVVTVPATAATPGRIHPVGLSYIDWPYFANEIEPAES